jgi:hypothetical protein
VSSAAVLTVVAVVLALVVLGLFRLQRALDSTELSLRRLAAGIRATRKDLRVAGQLAAAVERDAANGQASLDRLEELKRRDRQP